MPLATRFYDIESVVENILQSMFAFLFFAWFNNVVNERLLYFSWDSGIVFFILCLFDRKSVSWGDLVSRLICYIKFKIQNSF